MSKRPIALSFLFFSCLAQTLLAAHGPREGLDAGIQEIAQRLTVALRDRGVKKLAVVEFTEVRGYPSALDHFLSEQLTTELLVASPGTFTVVERRQLDRIREEQRLTSSDFFDQDSLANVGRVLGLDAIITGTIADLGQSVRINARAIAIETAEVFEAASTTVPKEGAVLSLLRQGAGPASETDSTAAGDRQIQASDVFFENQLLRLTVASVGVADDRKKAAVTLTLENLTTEPLLLAVPMQNSMGDCSISLTDERGNSALARRLRVGGITCLYDSRLVTTEDYTSFGPKSRSTLTLPFSSSEPLGGRFSLSIVFKMHQKGTVRSFSAGLANIKAR